MNKGLLKRNGLFTALLLAASLNLQAQVDGDWRIFNSGKSWFNTSTTNSGGTYQVYSAATKTWTNTQPQPTTTTNLWLRDGFGQTSTHSTGVPNNDVQNLYLGEGGGLFGSSTISGGAVTNITIPDAGSFALLPFINIMGAATTQAAASATSYKVTGVTLTSAGGTLIGGTAYDNTTTVTIGTAWAANTAYAVGTQRFSNGNLYTVTTAGTSSAAGLNGTGDNIVDGTAIWKYSGPAATASPMVEGGSVTGITITNQGSGYTSIPGLTISGPGTGAIYAAKVGIEGITITNAGAGYTTAPYIFIGAGITIGNGSSSNRTLVASGDVVVNKGGNVYPGTGTENLRIGGNLSAETPIVFRAEFGTFVANTNVTFTKAGTSSTSGAKMIFNNLTVNAGTTLNVTNEIVVLGTLTNNGTINKSGSIAATTTAGTGTINTVLPIELEFFVAKPSFSSVDIKWSTLSENSLEKFIVEKSTDGIIFTKLGEVKAKGPSFYSLSDNNPSANGNYYRLAQFDLDGSSKVCNPVFAKIGSQSKLSVYPNPSSGSELRFTAGDFSGETKVVLRNIKGDVVFVGISYIKDNEPQKLNLKAPLAPGSYLLQLSNADHAGSTRLIVW